MRFFAPQGRHVAPMGVKFGVEEARIYFPTQPSHRGGVNDYMYIHEQNTSEIEVSKDYEKFDKSGTSSRPDWSSITFVGNAITVR